MGAKDVRADKLVVVITELLSSELFPFAVVASWTSRLEELTAGKGTEELDVGKDKRVVGS